MEWRLVHSEQNPWPAGYSSTLFKDKTEFVLYGEVSSEDLVVKAKQIFEERGLLLIAGNLWIPEDRQASKRWLSEIAVTSNPAVYPKGIGPASWETYIAPTLIEGLGIEAADKWYETIAEDIKEILVMVMMIMMMGFVMMSLMDW